MLIKQPSFKGQAHTSSLKSPSFLDLLLFQSACSLARWHRFFFPSCRLELITSGSLWLSGSLKNCRHPEFLLIIGSDHFIRVIQEDRSRESRVEGLLDRFNLSFFSRTKGFVTFGLHLGALRLFFCKAAWK